MGGDGDPRRPQLTPARGDVAVWTLAAGALAALLFIDAVPAPLAAGAVLFAAALPALLRGPRVLGAAGALTSAAILLTTLIAQHSLPGAAAAASPQREVERRLAAAERELTRAAARVAADPGLARDAGSAFDVLAGAVLPRDGGITLYRGGEAAAWAGQSSRVPPGALDPGTHVIGDDGRPVLAVAVPAGGAQVLVVQAPLLTLFDGLSAVRVTTARPDEIEAIERSVAAPGGPGRPGTIVLRSASGSPYGIAAVGEAPPPTASGRSATWPHLALLGLLVLLAGAVARRRSGWTASVAAAVLVVAARLAAGTAIRPLAPVLFDPAALAVVSPRELFSTPGDLLLSGLAALGLTLLGRRPGQPRDPARAPASLALASGQAALLGLAAGLALDGWLALVRRVAENSEIDLADFSILPFDPVRLAVLVGLQLTAVALVLLAASVVARLARPLGEGFRPVAVVLIFAAVATLAIASGRADLARDPWPAVLAGALGLLIAALAFADASRPARRPTTSAFGVLATALLVLSAGGIETRRALLSFVRNDLAESIRRHGSSARHLLDSVLADLAGRWGEELAHRRPDDLAFRVWRESLLSRERFRAVIDARAESGEVGRFSHRLPLPPGVREVEPGNPTLQDVPFQGRSLRVLAGSRILSDRTKVTVRIAEDPIGLPFFHDWRYPRELSLSPGRQHARYLLRAEGALTVTNPAGRVQQATVPPGLRLPRRVLDRALEREEPLWWTARDGDRRLDVLSFAAGDLSRVLSISLPRPTLATRVKEVVHLLLFLAALAAIGLLAAAALLADLRRSIRPVRFVLASAYRKTFLVLAGSAVLVALAFSLYLRNRVESQLLQELRGRAVASLEFARNLLSEFAAAEPDAPIDDSTLIWVSQTIGYDLALYRDDRIEATSMRELFREGLLAERPDAAAYRAVRLDGAPIHVGLKRVGGPIALQAAVPFGERHVLGLVSVAHEEEIAQEAAARTQPIFLATAGLVVIGAVLARIVARRATQPLLALAAAASRVARGDLAVRIASNRQDEVRQLVDAFNHMAVELERQRRALDAHAAYLSRLLDNAPLGVLSIDGNGVVTTANPAARELFGSGVSAGRPLAEALAAPALGPLASRLQGRAAAEREELELGIPDGAIERTLRAVIIPLPSPGGSLAGRLVLVEDISDLVKSKKLEAWAEMARRIAHEIKNPLTPIQLNAEHLLRYRRDGKEGFDRVLHDAVGTILRQVELLRRIAREFSAYASGPVPVRAAPVDVGRFVGEVAAPYLGAPRPGVDFRVEVEPDAGTAAIDAARIQRALVNLIENGMQAMPGGGTLTLRAGRRGLYLVLEVVDTGVGFPDEVRSRLFEPYFSTKDAGTGLGLANARQAAEDHGGFVTVESAPGKGARVALMIPLESRPRQA